MLNHCVYIQLRIFMNRESTLQLRLGQRYKKIETHRSSGMKGNIITETLKITNDEHK